MTLKRFFAPVLMVAGLGLAVAPAMAQSPAPAPAPSQAVVMANDPARVQVVESIITNLGLYDIMVHVGQKTLTEGQSANNLTSAQKAQLSQNFTAAMAKRRTTIIHKLAMGARGDYSVDQLTNISSLSRIKYVHDLVAQGADPNLVADASTMSVAEQNLVQTLGNQAYVGDFLTNAINYDVIRDDIIAATTEAYAGVGSAS